MNPDLQPVNADASLLSPTLPAQIGKYRVHKKLGEGATSEVFLARDEFHERDVAIKRVRPSAADSPEGHFHEHFFAAEAALVGKLQHPNVVQLFDAVAGPEESYLVMEYVPGATMRRHCRADQLLSLEQIVEIGFKCAMALGYVSRQGLIHRDVKPANILIDRAGTAKLADFGIARLEASPGLTGTGMFIVQINPSGR